MIFCENVFLHKVSHVILYRKREFLWRIFFTQSFSWWTLCNVMKKQTEQNWTKEIFLINFPKIWWTLSRKVFDRNPLSLGGWCLYILNTEKREKEDHFICNDQSIIDEIHSPLDPILYPSFFPHFLFSIKFISEIIEKYDSIDGILKIEENLE